MKNYRYIYREKRSLISFEAHLRQYIDHRDILGSIHKYAFLYVKNGLGEELHLNDDNQKWYRLGKKFLDKRFVKRLLNDGKLLRQGQKLFISDLRSLNLKESSDEKIIELFLQAYRLYSRARGFFKTSRYEFQSAAETRLKALLLKKLRNPEGAREAFELLITPHKFDGINQEFRDWVKMLQRRYDELHILRHLDQYPWLVAQSYDLKAILRIFKKQFYRDQKNLGTFKEKLRNLTQTKRALFIKQQTLLRSFGNPRIDYLAWLFQEIALERIRLKGGWAGADFLYHILYSEISRRTHVSIKDLCTFYRISEVVKAIRALKPTVLRAELNRRKISYVLLLKGGRVHFYSGRPAAKIITQELQYFRNKLDTDIVGGNVASSGIAKGRVRIVIGGDVYMLRDFLKSFRKGEIMVTPMTQPNMVRIMKKAAAIVTDEGGLVSHAAIMAREFGIPCIVGTEIATKIFKDGDLVEVDANKGIVKILKKA